MHGIGRCFMRTNHVALESARSGAITGTQYAVILRGFYGHT